MKRVKISLAAARVNAKMTQKEVAKKLKVSHVTVLRWEKGQATPSYAALLALSDLYDLPISVFSLPKKLT